MPPMRREGVPNRAIEMSGRIVKGDADNVSPVPTTGRTEAKTRTLPSHGLASTSFDKTIDVPHFVGSHLDAYKPA